MSDSEMPFRVRRRRRLNFSWHTERPESMSDVFDQWPLPICYIVTVLDSISINIALRRGGAPVPLSKQEIIDCLPPRRGLRRRPDIPQEHYEFEERRVVRGIYLVPRYVVYNYVAEFGVCLEEDYPYLRKRGWRREPPSGVRRVQIQGGRAIPPGTPHEVIKRIIDREGSLTASLRTYESFSAYRRGIYAGRTGPGDMPGSRHAIVVTGYGRKRRGPLAGTEFYTIKNSSGPEWGKEGYGKIKCDLLFNFMYPIIDEED